MSTVKSLWHYIWMLTFCLGLLSHNMSNNVYQVFIADEHIRSVEMKVTHIHNICNSAKNNINASTGSTCEATYAAA